jgi:hypothetical protein
MTSATIAIIRSGGACSQYTTIAGGSHGKTDIIITTSEALLPIDNRLGLNLGNGEYDYTEQEKLGSISLKKSQEKHRDKRFSESKYRSPLFSICNREDKS